MTPEEKVALDQKRAADLTTWAKNLRAFAARQEARAPGRMDHITGRVLRGADLAERAAAAFSTGDRALGHELRAEYASLNLSLEAAG